MQYFRFYKHAIDRIVFCQDLQSDLFSRILGFTTYYKRWILKCTYSLDTEVLFTNDTSLLQFKGHELKKILMLSA